MQQALLWPWIASMMIVWYLCDISVGLKIGCGLIDLNDWRKVVIVDARYVMEM